MKEDENRFFFFSQQIKRVFKAKKTASFKKKKKNVFNFLNLKNIFWVANF